MRIAKLGAIAAIAGTLLLVSRAPENTNAGAAATSNGRQLAPGEDSLSDATAAVVPEDDPAAALHLANEWSTRFPEVLTYVDADAVHFRFPSEEHVAVTLPENRMVVAAAPYIERTHPCVTHTMTTCRSELRNEPVEVTVLDAGRDVVVSKNTKTLDNGFVEIWVPRDERFTLRIDGRNLSGEAELKTSRNSSTCLTEELRLS